MDPTSASTQALQDTDDFLLFDPRAGRTARPAAAGRNRQQFSEATVFVVGGGSYVEFTNLGEYAARGQPVGGVAGVVGAGASASTNAPSKRITYGATEIVPPGDFLKSLGALARAGQ